MACLRGTVWIAFCLVFFKLSYFLYGRLEEVRVPRVSVCAARLACLVGLCLPSKTGFKHLFLYLFGRLHIYQHKNVNMPQLAKGSFPPAVPGRSEEIATQRKIQMKNTINKYKMSTRFEVSRILSFIKKGDLLTLSGSLLPAPWRCDGWSASQWRRYCCLLQFCLTTTLRAMMYKLHNPAAEKGSEHDGGNEARKGTGCWVGSDWLRLSAAKIPHLAFYHRAPGGRPKDSSLLGLPSTLILQEMIPKRKIHTNKYINEQTGVLSNHYATPENIPQFSPFSSCLAHSEKISCVPVLMRSLWK